MMPAVDRISNLPKNVTEAILMHLPLRDAVRTCILSRNWRYEWNTIPQLLFDENCFPHPEGREHIMYDRNLVKAVNQVLLLHHGPIRNFNVAINLMRCGDIDRWVGFVSRNGIKEFTLKILEDGFYRVSSWLYLCEELTYLSLCGCTISLPTSFKGFSSLTTLDLQFIDSPNNALDVLISVCPLLTKVVLEDISNCDHLNIYASKLVKLQIDVEFEDICFLYTPVLAILSINLQIGDDRVVTDEAVCKLVEVFGSIPRLENLELCGDTFRILSDGDLPFKLPTACQLKYLSIALDFKDMQQMFAALCIFRSSPILQGLHMKAFSDKSSPPEICIEDFWEAEEDFGYLFSQLQIVEVTNFTGNASELKFVEFVLANAPVLETVQIELDKKVAGDVFLRKMIRFRRLSSKAEIIFPEEEVL